MTKANKRKLLLCLKGVIGALATCTLLMQNQTACIIVLASGALVNEVILNYFPDKVS